MSQILTSGLSDSEKEKLKAFLSKNLTKSNKEKLAKKHQQTKGNIDKIIRMEVNNPDVFQDIYDVAWKNHQKTRQSIDAIPNDVV